MPRNGSGTYSLPVAPFVTGAVISSADMNSDLSDIASALTQSVSRDGQTAMTGALNMGGNALSGVSTLTTTGAVTLGSTLLVTGATTLKAALTGTTGAFSGAITAANGTSGSQVVNFAQFAQLLSPNGYITLPNGLLVQWGNDTSVVGNKTTIWPLAFSAAPWAIFALIKDMPLAGSTTSVGVSPTPTATQAVFVTLNSATGALTPANYFWLAIGPA